MTTVFSIRKAAHQKCKYSKPRVIQSPAAFPSYTLLPPSPPHKHMQHQHQHHHNHNHNHHNSSSTIISSSIDSTLSVNSRDVIVADQWIVLSKIGEGSFGEVFEAEDIFTRRHYAIKREPLDTPLPQLEHESIMYDVLMGGPGIPQCQWYGEHDDFACIVIDLLGPSLEQVREAVLSMPLQTVVNLGCQMISILEHIHGRGIVYRDVKPDNFLLPAAACRLPDSNVTATTKNNLSSSSSSSSGSSSHIFGGDDIPGLSIVDFGLATWWRSPQTNRPYPQSKRRIKNKAGTALYASLNVHRGKMHARRDDMESLGYVLVDLATGSLPWTGIQARNSKEGWDRMRHLKESLPLAELCEGLPVGFMEWIEYTRQLQFSDQPNYDYLRRLLRESCQPESQYGKRVVPRDEANKKRSHVPLPSMRKANNGNNNSKSSEEGVFVMEDLAQELSGMSVTSNGDGGKRIMGRKRRNSSKKQQQQQQQLSSKRTPPSPPSPTSFPVKKRGANATTTASIGKNVGWNTHKHRHSAMVVQPHPAHAHEYYVPGDSKPFSWCEQQSKPAWDDHRPPPSWFWEK
ncbi:kinase-like domain-containing protein [Dichotomocladium elegans]|nr:kinase-like domain-containing protein [Dichotomocladium elegans]